MSSIAFSKTYCENYNDLRLQLFMLKYICLINDVQSTQRMLCNKQSTVNLYHQPVTNSKTFFFALNVLNVEMSAVILSMCGMWSMMKRLC